MPCSFSETLGVVFSWFAGKKSKKLLFMSGQILRSGYTRVYPDLRSAEIMTSDPGIPGSEITVRIEVCEYRSWYWIWVFKHILSYSVLSSHFEVIKKVIWIQRKTWTLQRLLSSQIRVYPGIPGSEISRKLWNDNRYWQQKDFLFAACVVYMQNIFQIIATEITI